MLKNLLKFSAGVVVGVTTNQLIDQEQEGMNRRELTSLITSLRRENKIEKSLQPPDGDGKTCLWVQLKMRKIFVSDFTQILCVEPLDHKDFKFLLSS